MFQRLYLIAFPCGFSNSYCVPGTILFIDDEIEMGFMVSNLFKHHGYKIFTAETIDVALDFADTIPFDAIVLDVNLGPDNGLKLMTFLHRNHREDRKYLTRFRRLIPLTACRSSAPPAYNNSLIKACACSSVTPILRWASGPPCSSTGSCSSSDGKSVRFQNRPMGISSPH